MIPVYVPQIIALAYIGTDLIVVVSFLRLRSRLSGINLNLVLFMKFRELAEFYSRGDTSAFMDRLAATPSQSLTSDAFTGSYGLLNREIENLQRQFGLPYKLRERPREMRNAMLELSVFAVLLTFSTALAAVSNAVLIGLLFAILLNTVFYYPFISLYYDSVDDLNEAAGIQSKMNKEDA